MDLWKAMMFFSSMVRITHVFEEDSTEWYANSKCAICRCLDSFSTSSEGLLLSLLEVSNSS